MNQLHLNNAIANYERACDTSLEECLRNHKEAILEAIESWDSKREYISSVHVKAIEEVMLRRK